MFEKEKNLVMNIEKEIGMNFKNKFILKEAFTLSKSIDSSISPEISNYDKSGDYQFDQHQLSFFGDGILDFVLSDFIFQNYQDFSLKEMETTLKHLRGYMIFEVLKKIHYGEILGLEYGSNYDELKYYTALIAAIYLDQGIERLKKFINEMISLSDQPPSLKHLNDLISKQKQELELKKDKIDQVFIAKYILYNQLIGVGEGLTERESIIDASAKSYEFLQFKNLTILSSSIRKDLTTTKTLELKIKMENLEKTVFKCLNVNKDIKKEKELLQNIEKAMKLRESNKKEVKNITSTPEKKRGYQEELKMFKDSKRIKM